MGVLKYKFIALAIFLLINCTIVLADSNSTSSDEWIMWGRTLDNNRVYPGEINLSNYGLENLTTLGGTTGTFTSPLINQGIAYLGAEDSKVYAINMSNESILWTYDTPNQIVSNLAYSQGNLYIPVDGNIPYIISLQASDQSQRWNFTPYYNSSGFTMMHSAPLIYDDYVIFGTGVYRGTPDQKESYLYALNDTDGSMIWNFSADNYISNAPALHEGIVYFSSADNKTYAVNISDGTEIWNNTLNGAISYSSPLYYDNKIFVGIGGSGSLTESFHALNSQTGAKIWNYTVTSGFGGFSSSAVAKDNIVYVSGDGMLYALNSSSGAKIWNLSIDNSVSSNPSIAGEYVLIGGNKKLYMINATSGSIEREYSFGGSYNPSDISSVNGSIIFTVGQTLYSITDEAKPVITLLSPEQNHYQLNQTVTFSFQTQDLDQTTTCNLSINNQVNQTGITANTGEETNITVNLPLGNYNWSISCTDSLSNTGFSEQRPLNIDCLDLSNGYDLTKSLTLDAECSYNFTGAETILFNISTSDVFLDCNNKIIDSGHIDNGKTFAYMGYSNTVSNITIKNCKAYNFDVALYIDKGTEDVNILNNTFTNFTRGISYGEAISSGTFLPGFQVQIENNSFYSHFPARPTITAIYRLSRNFELINNIFNVSGDLIYWGNMGADAIHENITIRDNTLFSSKDNANMMPSYTIYPRNNVSIYNNRLYNNLTINDNSIGNNVKIYNNSFYNPSIDLNKDSSGGALAGISFCENGTGNYYYEGSWGQYCSPIITLTDPENNTNSSNNTIQITFSSTDQNNDTLNCSLILDATTNQTNILINSEEETNRTINNLTDGMHNWSITCKNSINQDSTTSQTRFFTIDTTAPNPPVFTANNLTATPNGFINITWSRVNDASKYMIFKNTSNISEIKSNLWIANTTNNHYFDAEVEHDSTYWYSIIAVDQLGNYNYQNNSESHNITANDIVKPQNPSNIVITQSGNTATIQWENITKDTDNMTDTITTYQVWYANTINTSKDYVNETLTFLKNVTSNTTTFTITSSKTYYFAITSIDEAGNKNLTLSNNHANQSLTYTAPPDNNERSSGGSSSSSSGGYIPSVDQNAQTKYVSQIRDGDSTDFEITRENISINKIRLTAKENKSSVGIEVKNIKEPQTTKKINKKTYQFLEINPKNIEDDEIEGAEIEFTINNTWIKTNNINKNTVTLLRYANDTWTELETKLKSSNTKTTIYTAYTPGFSYFAITGEEEKEEITEDKATEENNTIQELMIQEEKTENTTNKTQEQNQSLNTSQKKIPITPYIIGILAFIVLSTATIYFILNRKDNQKKKKK